MKDRLIELIENVQCTARIPWGDDFRGKLADHLLANGVILPPCKVGDTVYTYDYLDYTYKLRESTVKAIKIQKNTMTNIQEFLIEYFYIENLFVCGGHGIFGDNVFLAKEEAEQALRKEDEGNDQRRTERADI